MCDVDVAVLFDRLPSQPTFYNTSKQPPRKVAKLAQKSTDIIAPNLDSVTAVEEMPRNGWPATLRYYNEKFGCTLDIDAFKKFAQNEAEREIRQEENVDRRRIATCLADTCTLTDTKEYINLIDKALSKIKEISEKEIGKVVVRTQKLPSELVDSKVLDLINRIIGEYADSCVPMTITAVARIIQAAQVCYDEATRKEKPRSA
ncbi:hypothetical protein CWI36_1941p0010 [Hamiltosporidium magnivora]|uniref:Uncharacterized protein n=1 Tax=Hamiltosporidium magnivora TaxID=148818 RepID=A0A4Q9KX98_9MICR|nr:hypothetical protein CWI36_1941p0010 [Hamiltosporidium magnivora]